MDTLAQDLRYAVRTLRRSPAFTLVAVATLALGIGANSAIWSAIDGVLLRPLPFAEPERLVRVAHLHPEQGLAPNDFSPQDFADLAAARPGFSSLAAYSYYPRLSGMNLTGEGEPARLETASVSGNFFSTLGAPAAAGRTLLPADDAPGHDRVAVISERLWRSRFSGDPAIAGRAVTLDGEPFTVAGVMPAGFDFPHADVDLWVPISRIGEDDIPHLRGLRWMEAVGRLAPGTTAEGARAAVDAVLARLAREYPETNALWGTAALVPLHEQVVGAVRPALSVLAAAVALVLLVACANLANLLLARASRRGRELAVRAAIGAGRARLARQLLTESALVALFGGVAGLAIAAWGVEALATLASRQLPRPQEIRLDGRILLLTLTVSLVAGLLTGLLPALRGSRAALTAGLKESGRDGGAGRGRLRAALVVAESALATALLVAAGLLLQSFWRLVNVDPGFHAEGVLAASISLDDARYPERPERDRFRREVRQRLGEIPGVLAVGGAKTLPLAGGGEPYSFTVGEREVTPAAGTFIVTPGYFEALGIPLVAGRTFSEQDGADAPPGLVVNRALAREVWPGKNPVGERVSLGSEITFTVLGVVGDVRSHGLADPAGPAMYVPGTIFSRSTMKLFVRTVGDPLRLAPAVRQAIAEVDPLQPVSDVAPLAAGVADTVARPRLLASLVALFGALAALLAALGLYGVVSYAVAERTREIGIRMALGERRGAVLGRVVGQGTGLAAAGVALGLAGSLAAARLLSSLLFGVAPGDPATFAGAAALLLAAALAASALPARRAASIDPAEAIRHE